MTTTNETTCRAGRLLSDGHRCECPMAHCEACKGSGVEEMTEEWGELVVPRCGACDGTGMAPADDDLQAACETCEWSPKAGADWNHFEPPATWPGCECEHMDARRYCSCCSEHWYRVGMEASWDIDGCAHEDCPDCVAWLASPEGIAEMARQAVAS